METLARKILFSFTFFIHVSDQIFPSSQLLPDPLPPSYMSNFMFFLSETITTTKPEPTNQQTNSTSITTTTNPKQNKTHPKEIRGVHLCWPTTARHEDYPKGWLVYPVSLHWRKLIFFFLVDVSCK